MTYLGDFAEDATVRRFFNTVDQNGAPVTIGGTAAAQVYKDSSVSQATAGVTVTEDFDGVTGLHLLEVDMSADANYTPGSDYLAVISVGTADSVSIVGGVLAQWSCENRTAVDVSIRDAAITANTFAIGVLSTDAEIATAVGTELEADFTAIPNAVWAVDASSSITLGSVKQTLVTTIPDDIAVVDGNVDVIVTDVAAILVDTGTSIPATIAALNNLDGAAVTAACTTSLNAYDPPTRTEATADKDELLTRLGTPEGVSVSADIAALNDLDSAAVIGACTSALGTYDPPSRTEATSDKDEILARLGAPAGASMSADVAAVKAETGLLTASQAEPTGVPAVDETPLDKLAYLYMALRNKLTVTASAMTFHDDTEAAEWKKALSDDGTTYTEGEAAAP